RLTGVKRRSESMTNDSAASSSSDNRSANASNTSSFGVPGADARTLRTSSMRLPSAEASSHGSTGLHRAMSMMAPTSPTALFGQHSASGAASAASFSTATAASGSSSSSSNPASASASRRSMHSPRDVADIAGRLVQRIHGAPTSLTTRRVLLRLSDAPPAGEVDSLVVLEKIKRKVVTDSVPYHPNPQRSIAQLHDVYGRFVKYKNINKKSEALRLLFALMNTGAPPEPSSTIPEPELPLPASIALPPPAPLSGDAPASSGSSGVTRSRTELDSLEESFKVSMGMPVPPSKHPSGRTSVRASLASSVTSTYSNQTSFDVPEEILLRDVLYALQAIDSRYLYFDPILDGFQIADNVGIPTPMRDLVQKLCELGWLYDKISKYLMAHREKLSFGVVGQSFCHVMNLELSDYFRLIAVLSAQVDEDAETKKPGERLRSELTLHKLLVWTQDPLDKMRLMARLIDSVDGLRGGALASGVHSFILHGDPSVSGFVRSVMKRVSDPMFRMIRRWVFEGELEDAHGEFFVVSDPNVPDDQLWARKYRLNKDMLPTFISIELANKILIIGKSINFIRQCCGSTNWVMDFGQEVSLSSSDTKDDGVQFAELIHLEAMIEKVSHTTNAFLIRALMDDYHLLDHCRALKNYLLLGQGDFIQYLMDLLNPELSKKAGQIYRHTLTNVLETALNSSNAKFESPDILARLDVELMQASDGKCDLGWNIFSLHYKLTAPINSVITDSTMRQYQRIFHFLWRMKRVEYSLSTSWSRDMNLVHQISGQRSRFRSIIHKCQLLRSEMIHFTTNLHNYMMFEVLETSWHTFVREIKDAVDLDQIIQSHTNYISAIKKNAFMAEDSREILIQVKNIFKTILQFCSVQGDLYTAALTESRDVLQRERQIQQRTNEGKWGLSDLDEAAKARSGAIAPDAKIIRQIVELTEAFTSQLLTLLELIKARDSTSQKMPFPIFRFDFNEYYRSKTHPPTEHDQ
ncbi:TPA: hypothetical protein N0F65_002291, partial [Lagenidium giganteum]